MPQMNTLVKSDPKRKQEYMARVARVQKHFERADRGAQAQCAFDTRIAPISISQVVHGKRVSVSTLELIEAWIRENA